MTFQSSSQSKHSDILQLNCISSLQITRLEDNVWHWSKMWRNLQLTSILLRRSTTRPTVFSSGGTHCAPPPATMRTCSTYCGTTTHVMSMIPRHQTAQPYATTSFASSIAMPYAVDAPNGDHDFQDLVRSVLFSSSSVLDVWCFAESSHFIWS